MAPRIVANILCHNDLIYLENLIPQVAEFADRIIVVDDCSTDGTAKLLREFPVVERIERKFDLNFSNQRNAGLQLVDNGDWVFRIDSDEVPTKWCVKNIRHVIDYMEHRNTNRTIMPIYHMINPAMCKVEIGYELRLFKKNESCVYVGKCHEIMHGEFGLGFGQAELPEWCALVHWKYADPKRIAYTEEFFLKNGLYDEGDWRRRKDIEATYLPTFVSYSLTQELSNYLCQK